MNEGRQENQRIANRVGVLKEVECRVGGQTLQAMLSNLSAGGCLLSTLDGMVEAGDSIYVALGDNLLRPGEVVWQHGNNAGIKFNEPLTRAQDHMP